jgi:hypothetical protein
MIDVDYQWKGPGKRGRQVVWLPNAARRVNRMRINPLFVTWLRYLQIGASSSYKARDLSSCFHIVAV